MHKMWEPKNACEKLLHPPTSPAAGPGPCRAHRGVPSTPGSLGHSKSRGERNKGCPDQQKTTQQSSNPGDHPGAWPSGGITTTAQGLAKFPRKTKNKNKVPVYFYKEKKGKKRKILKENDILSMFIQSMLKDSRGPEWWPGPGGAARGLPVPGASPGPRGRGEGEDEVMERGEDAEDSQRSLQCRWAQWLCDIPIPLKSRQDPHQDSRTLTRTRSFAASPRSDQTITSPRGIPEKSSSAKPPFYKNL